MTVADLIRAMEEIAPRSLAEQWDNVGLLVGRAEAPLRAPTLLTIDFTEEVLEEALRIRAGAVIAYHPPMFQPIQRLTAADARGRVLLGAVEAGMAIYSPHTALDATPGGVTDWLCDMLAPEEDIAGIAVASGVRSASIGDRRALNPHTGLDPRATHKIVTFVPETALAGIRNALASIGAGRIGLYELCSFSLEGSGTFRALKGANPAVGQAQEFETVREARLEMVCPAEALGLACEMIRQFHPYEEPAWDVYPLAPKPDRRVGAGRRLVLDRPATATELAKRLKQHLGVDGVRLAAAHNDPIDHVGVCPGAGASLLEAAIADGCQAFVTGEIRHHEAASAVARGVSIIVAGHTNTERGYLPTLARRLNELAPGVDARVSQADRTLFRTI